MWKYSGKPHKGIACAAMRGVCRHLINMKIKVIYFL